MTKRLSMSSTLNYQSGFGNYFSTESVKDALPKNRNSPQRHHLGLYPEQLSGSAFTALPHENLRTWMYRILPSVTRSNFRSVELSDWKSIYDDQLEITPSQLRWSPQASLGKGQKYSFIEGISTYAVAGDARFGQGCAAHLYRCNKSMETESFVNADAEMLVLPQSGSLFVRTELGLLFVDVGELVCIPRGLAFAIDLKGDDSHGYVCENFGQAFQLPYRGPIGANGLANTRDFLYPTAAFFDAKESHTQYRKFYGQFFVAEFNHNPFDVVAWHGNYAPYKYDLRNFNTINTVSYDHPDPSIFTVLTSPGTRPGIANIDFVIFPPRWMVAEDTFRPPWYHRNIMSEFMGLLYGSYDAKPGAGFSPGGASIHNMMTAHGPDKDAFTHASEAKLAPHKIENTMAFMFECSQAFLATKSALKSPSFQNDYPNCWDGLKRQFKLKK